MASILLVDDEKVARAMYRDFLTGAGHSVTTAASVTEAKEVLRDQRFDVVVTDLLLPHGNGMEVLQHVKDAHPSTEVLVITALDKVDPAVRAIKSGAADYLVKPVNPDVLAHAVSKCLTTRSLLRENEELRRHVAMLETAQRIATTLDRERLASTACAAFVQVCNADAAVFLSRHEGAFKPIGQIGLVAEEAEALMEKAAALVHPLWSKAPAAGMRVPGEGPGQFRCAFLAPAIDAEVPLGGMVLLFKHEPADVFESAPYLARHLALALRNLGRFAEVEDLVYLDDLTHLFNSRYLELVLDKEIKNAAQLQRSSSLLFLDLDYFKSVNDTHGHVVGSKLLVEVARILKNCVRDNDVVCRWGGDEYVILLRGTDSGGAFKVGERIRRSIESHHFLAREGFSLSITTCIGIASFPEHAQDKDLLLDFADRAMYRGKKGSRNIIYMAAKGLEATPLDRKHPDAPPEAKAADAKTAEASETVADAKESSPSTGLGVNGGLPSGQANQR